VAEVSFSETVRESVIKILANVRQMLESATANVTQGAPAALTKVIF
jgi:hypothetical protein